MKIDHLNEDLLSSDPFIRGRAARELRYIKNIVEEILSLEGLLTPVWEGVREAPFCSSLEYERVQDYNQIIEKMNLASSCLEGFLYE